MNRNILKEKFGDSKRWVAFRIEERKGKKTKLPYSLSGKLASSTDPKTWATYDEVEKVISDPKKKFDGLGIVFTPEENLLGIDIDHVIEDGKIGNEFAYIQKFIDECDTYTEVSPSKTGLHLFFELSDPLKLVSNKKAPFEAYTSGRYFTVTNNPFGDAKEIRTISSEDALKILSKIGYPWNEKKETKAVAESSSPLSLDDSQILEKMFSSKNGEKIKSLYNGDLSENNNDASAADLSLCSHLAFWTGRDSSQIERIWIFSPLGSREKTQKRKDYRMRTVGQAISNCKEVYEPKKISEKKSVPDLNLLYTINREKEKVIIQNTENICRVLMRDPGFRGKLRFDEFKGTLEIFSDKQNKWRVMEDNDAVNIQTQIQVEFPCFGKVGKEMVYDAMIKTAKDNAIDSARDWLLSLEWDKTERLDSWIFETYGVKNDEYHKAVASNWMKGLVKRIMLPGCKFDYVLVLEGKQGTKKSTSLGVLGNDWHVETTMSTDSKDFFMQFQGKAIIEFSEGETLSRTEVKRMKAIITMQSDKYRPPYERVSQEFPRRCVFAMTTNLDQYLKDETGNRRWLPVACNGIANVNWLKENRDQLFAEAFHRVITLKETVHEFPEEETARQQLLRQTVDPREEIIYEWFYKKLGEEERSAGITTREAYINGVHGGSLFGKEMGRLDEMIISSILKDGLKLEKRRITTSGARYYRYFETEESRAIAPFAPTTISIESEYAKF